MTIRTTYTQARANLANLLDQVTHNREVVVIQQGGKEEVAMIAASELVSLMETAYLLRSPSNQPALLQCRLGHGTKIGGIGGGTAVCLFAPLASPGVVFA